MIINDPVAEARALLESAEYGLVVEVRREVDAEVAAGLVINTDPAPNTLVDRGSTVVLIVSSGPGQERVPPLIGTTEAQARNKLRDLGFGTPNVTYRDLPPGDPSDGTVLEQSVPAAELVDKGTVIDLVVGRATVAQTTTTTPAPRPPRRSRRRCRPPHRHHHRPRAPDRAPGDSCWRRRSLR